MMTHNALQVSPAQSEGSTLLLAPFGREELAGVYPIDPLLMTFLPVESQAVYSGDPDRFLRLEAELDHTETWGMYLGRVSPEHFAGAVSLSDTINGGEGGSLYTDLEKTVGTFIMDRAQKGKGLGTLAKVAVIAHTLKTGRTHAFQAWVADDNAAAQRSLGKAGFVHRSTHEIGQLFPNGQAAQDWVLATPKAQPALAANERPGFQALLQDGWRRFDAARRTIEVRTIDGA